MSFWMDQPHVGNLEAGLIESCFFSTVSLAAVLALDRNDRESDKALLRQVTNTANAGSTSLTTDNLDSLVRWVAARTFHLDWESIA